MTAILNSLSRKLIFGVGAIVVSTMTLTGAADAKSSFNLTLQFGRIGGYMPYYGGYYGATVNICDWYWWKYEQTGKFKYKKKYMKCMGYL